MFYFGNRDSLSNVSGTANGLLHPTWELFKAKPKTQNIGGGFGQQNVFSTSASELNYYDYNSAWSYLKLNDENERAEKLEKFVTLLSNINCFSPWYFTSISGIDSALERKGPDDREVKFDESKKLTITCLPDSFDNRIGTLLELYRDISWSWQNKKEIIPSNLRKFDMAIYIFESTINNWHKDEDNIGDDDYNKYITSYKMLEFHDCEFSYNSLKSGFGDVNNQLGFKPTYSIEISYGDCYEVSYNEHLMRKIGDIIKTDTYQAVINNNVVKSNESYESEAQTDRTVQSDELSNRQKQYYLNDGDYFNGAKDIYSFGNLEMRDNQSYTANYGRFGDPEVNKRALHDNVVLESDRPGKKGFLGNALGNLLYGAKQQLDNVLYDNFGFTTSVNDVLLGNLYTYSFTKIGTQLSELFQGNLVKAGQSIKQYIENAQKRKNDGINIPPNGNLGTGYGDYDEQQPSGNLGTGYGDYENKSAEGEIFDSTPVSYKGYGVSLGNLSNRGKLHPSSIANN
jgi:hypothetical protein